MLLTIKAMLFVSSYFYVYVYCFVRLLFCRALIFKKMFVLQYYYNGKTKKKNTFMIIFLIWKFARRISHFSLLLRFAVFWKIAVIILTGVHGFTVFTVTRRVSLPSGVRVKDEAFIHLCFQDVVKYELDTEVNADQETLTVTTRERLGSSHYYSLFVNFTGNISHVPDKGGFFKAVFYEHQKQSWYVATKLAPQGARHLLPCVDGRTHKASFEVSVIRRNGTSVIFNTKLRKTEP